MIRFACPLCEAILRVPPEYVGLRGHCNKCGGRIALLGNQDDGRVQRASIVADAPPEPPDTRPATLRQIDHLRRAGMTEAGLGQLTRSQASTLILRQAQRRGQDAPTEKQLGHLQRLGASQAQLDSVRTRAEASALIEEMHLRPTAAQIKLLNELGATGEHIARLKSKGEASALIDDLKNS
ncbi:MAG: hypothetical protein HYZ00_02430 [Candidatus Hydrogenedentes bacterium]|nr:hypothetical protein [Candidatus Hydrogenedentota bacterium]